MKPSTFCGKSEEKEVRSRANFGDVAYRNRYALSQRDARPTFSSVPHLVSEIQNPNIFR